MANRRILILDGSHTENERLSNILAGIVRDLDRQGSAVQVISLREKTLGACTGCYGCWLKTPGMCVQRDEGTEIARLVMQSDITLFFCPVVFGGYTPLLKRIIDRVFSSVNLPYMQVKGGETHHLPRYPRYPRLIGVGVQSQPDREEVEIFKGLVARNSINLHASTFAAEVVSIQETPDQIQQRLQPIFLRNDPLPVVPTVVPAPGLAIPAPTPGPSRPRRVLLIHGSPRTGHPTTSASLGRFLAKRLAANGWESEEISLKANILRETGEVELIDAAGRCGLIVLLTPLYNDSLPTYVIEGLIRLNQYQSRQAQAARKQFVAIVNNGFPEAHHAVPALHVCWQFARKSGFDWLGGLALPAGEALCDGLALNEVRRKIPSVAHIKKALEWTAGSLNLGQPVPELAVTAMAKTPVPHSPFWIWRRIFLKVAARRWETRAAANGVSREELVRQPLIG
jgi:multimeric flavodoxin WrbA